MQWDVVLVETYFIENHVDDGDDDYDNYHEEFETNVATSHFF